MTAPTMDRPEVATSALGNLDFLDEKHPIYLSHLAAWTREERRYEGADGVLDELEDFVGETAERLQTRKDQASYLNFGRIHAQTLAGHIARVTPLPKMGGMGEIRTREEITDAPTVAERLYYNVDGIGNDGSQWGAWWTEELERSLVTGHRWVMVEMPRAPSRVGVGGSVILKADVEAGHRPYLVGRSPLAVTMWETTSGRLDWLVIREPVGTSGIKEGKWQPAPTEDGYYLLVRSGYDSLGDAFRKGGWWLFDSEKKPVTSGDWSKTKGQIPMFLLVGCPSKGTKARPAISRSLTMELGQISVSLMNRISERNYDARDSAKSTKYILGPDLPGWDLLVSKLKAGEILVPVLAPLNKDGTPSGAVPGIYDSSAGAVASGVYSTIITSTIDEAHEIMVRQVTSTPDSSGASKAAGFSESVSPLLAGLAQRCESAMNTAIYFAELRAGFQKPSGSVEIPTNVEIEPLKSKIDETMARMKSIGASSPTLAAAMIVAGAQEDSLIADEDIDAVTEELTASLTLANAKEQALTLGLFAGAAVPLGAAAQLAGMSEEDQKLLVEGSAFDNASPTGGVVQ